MKIKRKNQKNQLNKITNEVWRKHWNNLLNEYDNKFIFEAPHKINYILDQYLCKEFLNYIEWTQFESENEFMRRYYNNKEIEVRLKNYTVHYDKYFCGYPTNYRLSKISECMQKRKRKLTKMMDRKIELEFEDEEKENKNNSNKKETAKENSSVMRKEKSREIEIKEVEKQFEKVKLFYKLISN